MDIKILSIETSGINCSIALSSNDDIIAQYTLTIPNIHDGLAAELIRRILLDNNLNVTDLSAVAVSSGPGSFTGLRIGTSLAKGLCFTVDKKDYNPKLIAVPTLKSLINYALKYYNLHKNQNIISIIPSQKDLIYYKIYTSGKYSDILLGNSTELNLSKYDAFLKIGPFYKNNKEFDFLNNLSAEKIALLAYHQYLNNEFASPETFRPNYIQEFIIKTKRKDLNI